MMQAGGLVGASSISLAMPFVYTKFRIIRGNFSLIFFEKLPLIHFTVLSLPKMFFCGANFFRGIRFVAAEHV